MITGCPLWDNIGLSDAQLSEERSRPHQGMSLSILEKLVRTCRASLVVARREDREPQKNLHSKCTRI